MVIPQKYMEIQFDVPKIESYSKALAEKLSNEFFSSSDAIRGEQILKLTSIEQINLFVIKNLLDKWKEESAKLKSPYFNYESQEVKEAIQNLLNKLSQNILIRKEFFKPLLEKAIIDTLYLVMKPEGFFSNAYSNKPEIRVADLKDTEKFFKINKNVIQEILREASKNNKVIFSGEELVNLSDRLVREYPLSGSEKEQYLEKFSTLLKLDFAAVSKPVPVQENKIEPVKPKIVSEGTILNEKFVGEQLTVNDLLKQKNTTTLADKIGKSKISTIKSAISLSQKFLFINALFKGVTAEYESALSGIDQCQNYDEALSLLNQNYASKYQWNFDQYEVKEFVEIVERKFS